MMSEIAQAITKVADSLAAKPKKSFWDRATTLGPIFIALASIVFSYLLAKADEKQKEQQQITTQMDAASKVLPYLSDPDERKNIMGLITLVNYHQDSLAMKLITMYPRSVQQQVSLYITLHSSDSSAVKQARKYLSPGETALQAAQNELAQQAHDYGNYSGPFVEKYNSFSNVPIHQPWACTFVSWCFNKDSSYFPPTGRTGDLEEYLRSKGATFSLRDTMAPQPGDIYFYDWNGIRAVGIVSSYLKNGNQYDMHGIEGNSNENPNAPNIKVAEVGFSKKDIDSSNMLFARVHRFSERH